MSGEITRAGDADRQRYIDHLGTLYAEGFITEPEVESLRAKILESRSLRMLEMILDGFEQPPPPMPAHPGRDWGVPRNFVPACTAAAAAGLMVAVIPATALAHYGDTFSNVLTAFSIVLGALMIVAAIIFACAAASCWEDSDLPSRQRRMAQEKARRNR